MSATSTTTPPLSALHFPSAEQPTVSQLLTSLRRSALSLPHRLRSVDDDSHFTTSVAHAYDRPLVANERCGSWYVPTDRKAGSAYFKSTDGHTGQWDFSLRRLNLQVLDIMGAHRGYNNDNNNAWAWDTGQRLPIDMLTVTVPAA